MKAFQTTTLLLLYIALSGCSTGWSGLPKFKIEIDSDPQSARVEVNNEYIGKTPCQYMMPGNADRSFNGNWIQGAMIEFTATPPAGSTNLFVQVKAFSPSAFMKQGDHIPEKMFFDLHQKTEHFNLK